MSDPLQQQITAVAAALGVALGMLRVKGLLHPQEVDAVLDAATTVIPENQQALADMLLAVIRDASRRVRAVPDPETPA